MPRNHELDALIVAGGEAEHEGWAIGAFRSWLEGDIREGRNVRVLPEELALAMLANVGYAENLGDEIDGEVAL